ncbi:integrase/recombinase XerD [Alkalibacillus flavidus]|uniref:Integrase/recombinase XerD n=1 Tax=Alkalibacillus flavidus TaxID=546021 RepID=A0ABV2KTM4_9BACI
MRQNASNLNSQSKSRRKNGMKLDDKALEAVKKFDINKEGMKRKSVTFNEAADDFMDYCDLKGLREDTKIYYKKELKQIRYHLMDLNITEPLSKDMSHLTEKHIYDTLRFMQEKGYKVSTINSRLVALKSFLNWAVDRQYFNQSPAYNIKKLRQRHDVGPTFNKTQLRKLLSAPDMHSFPGFRDTCVMTLLADTGCRVSELVALKLNDIDLSESLVMFNETKNGMPRTIPLTNRLKKLLGIWINDIRGHCDNHALFITVDNSPINVRTVQEQIKFHSRKTGVENEVNASPHAFRRTFAKNKIAAGVNIFVVQKYMGHSSLDMLKRYVLIYGPDLKESIEEGIE